MEKLICPCFHLLPCETDGTQLMVYEEISVYRESVYQGRRSTLIVCGLLQVLYLTCVRTCLMMS